MLRPRHLRCLQVIIEGADGDHLRISGPAADTWSVGVVIYEMLTGELPFNVAKADARQWCAPKCVFDDKQRAHWELNAQMLAQHSIWVSTMLLLSFTSTCISSNASSHSTAELVMFEHRRVGIACVFCSVCISKALQLSVWGLRPAAASVREARAAQGYTMNTGHTVSCWMQEAAVALAHSTGAAVQHPILDRIRSCSTVPDAAASFFEGLFYPVPEQRLTPQSYPYIKPTVEAMLQHQAEAGLTIASTGPTDQRLCLTKPQDCSGYSHEANSIQLSSTDLPNGVDPDDSQGASATSWAVTRGQIDGVDQTDHHSHAAKQPWWRLGKRSRSSVTFLHEADDYCQQQEQPPPGSQQPASKQGFQLPNPFRFCPRRPEAEKATPGITAGMAKPPAPLSSSRGLDISSVAGDLWSQHGVKVPLSNTLLTADASLHLATEPGSHTSTAAIAPEQDRPVPPQPMHAGSSDAELGVTAAVPPSALWQSHTAVVGGCPALVISDETQLLQSYQGQGQDLPEGPCAPCVVAATNMGIGSLASAVRHEAQQQHHSAPFNDRQVSLTYLVLLPACESCLEIGCGVLERSPSIPSGMLCDCVFFLCFALVDQHCNNQHFF